MDEIRAELADYDTSIYTEVGYDSSADLQSEMSVIIVIAAVIIVLVLTLTSRSYAEVPVLIMTFGAAALLNMGTNFLCGTISFISNSVTVILQLALAIDYADHSVPPLQRRARDAGRAGSLHCRAFQGHPGDFFLLAYHHQRPGRPGVHALWHWPRPGYCADQGHPVQYAVVSLR